MTRVDMKWNNLVFMWKFSRGKGKTNFIVLFKSVLLCVNEPRKVYFSTFCRLSFFSYYWFDYMKCNDEIRLSA